MQKVSYSDNRGQIHKIILESASWKYVGFEAYVLGREQRLHLNTGGQEVCLVRVQGKTDVEVGDQSFRDINLPPRTSFTKMGISRLRV